VRRGLVSRAPTTTALTHAAADDDDNAGDTDDAADDLYGDEDNNNGVMTTALTVLQSADDLAAEQRRELAEGERVLERERQRAWALKRERMAAVRRMPASRVIASASSTSTHGVGDRLPHARSREWVPSAHVFGDAGNAVSETETRSHAFALSASDPARSRASRHADRALAAPSTSTHAPLIGAVDASSSAMSAATNNGERKSNTGAFNVSRRVYAVVALEHAHELKVHEAQTAADAAAAAAATAAANAADAGADGAVNDAATAAAAASSKAPSPSVVSAPLLLPPMHRGEQYVLAATSALRCGADAVSVSSASAHRLIACVCTVDSTLHARHVTDAYREQQHRLSSSSSSSLSSSSSSSARQLHTLRHVVCAWTTDTDGNGYDDDAYTGAGDALSYALTDTFGVRNVLVCVCVSYTDGAANIRSVNDRVKAVVQASKVICDNYTTALRVLADARAAKAAADAAAVAKQRAHVVRQRDAAVAAAARKREKAVARKIGLGRGNDGTEVSRMYEAQQTLTAAASVAAASTASPKLLGFADDERGEMKEKRSRAGGAEEDGGTFLTQPYDGNDDAAKDDSQNNDSRQQRRQRRRDDAVSLSQQQQQQKARPAMVTDALAARRERVRRKRLSTRCGAGIIVDHKAIETDGQANEQDAKGAKTSTTSTALIVPATDAVIVTAQERHRAQRRFYWRGRIDACEAAVDEREERRADYVCRYVAARDDVLRHLATDAASVAALALLDHPPLLVRLCLVCVGVLVHIDGTAVSWSSMRSLLWIRGADVERDGDGGNSGASLPRPLPSYQQRTPDIIDWLNTVDAIAIPRARVREVCDLLANEPTLFPEQVRILSPPAALLLEWVLLTIHTHAAWYDDMRVAPQLARADALLAAAQNDAVTELDSWTVADEDARIAAEAIARDDVRGEVVVFEKRRTTMVSTKGLSTAGKNASTMLVSKRPDALTSSLLVYALPALAKLNLSTSVSASRAHHRLRSSEATTSQLLPAVTSSSQTHVKLANERLSSRNASARHDRRLLALNAHGRAVSARAAHSAAESRRRADEHERRRALTKAIASGSVAPAYAVITPSVDDLVKGASNERRKEPIVTETSDGMRRFAASGYSGRIAVLRQHRIIPYKSDATQRFASS
jgi:hypothetical protein